MKSEMGQNDRPLSELYRLKGLEWADEQAAWYAMSETKATVLARLTYDTMESMRLRGEKPTHAKAEMLARCSEEWEQFLHGLANHNEKRLILKVELDSLSMQHHEMIDANANARKERGM